MSVLDVFNNEMFGLVSLTTAINKLPEQPGILGRMGLFKPKPINTLSALIEEKQGKLSLVTSSPRGTRTAEVPHAKRKVRSIVIPHFQEDDIVLADAIQGIRDFGQETGMQSITTVVNDRLQAMKTNLDATREWQRVGALQGVVYEADGSTEILDLFTLFGVSQQTQEFDFSRLEANVTEDVKITCNKLRRKIEHAIGATPFTGITAICGDNFFDAFIGSFSVKQAYLNWTAARMLQESENQRKGFEFADITWMNYSTKIGSTFLIPEDYAFFIPTGTMDLFQEYFAPADYIETVNTMGQEYYAKQERYEFDKGIKLQAQSNFLSICTRPGVPVKGDFVTNDD